MEKTLCVLNELEKEGILQRYAIGGAVAVAFYMEPVLTYDLDVFVSIPESGGAVISLAPIYDRLRDLGYEADREHVLIEGVPVQFLPAYNPLIEEALHEARETAYGATQTRVVRAEHLLAIMLQTNRPKDKTRIVQLLDAAELDPALLTRIVDRHGLERQWSEFGR